MFAAQAALRAAALFALAPLGETSAADWLQFGYDAQHSGNNPEERVITRDNVAQLTLFHAIDLLSPPEETLAAPVYLARVPTPAGLRNFAFVLAEAGSLYAIDVATGAIAWSHVQPPPEDFFHVTQSSPAIDPNRQFVYAYQLDGKVHKFAVGDGTEIVDVGWPEIVTLKPQWEHVASALAIATAANGRSYLYAVTDGYYGDGGDYQGHVTAIDLASGEQKVFNSLCSDITTHFIENGEPGVTACNSTMSGIWGRPGAVYDAGTDRVLVATSNGWFDANIGGYDWGDSVLALAPDGSGGGFGLPLDSFSPDNYDELRQSDLDFGAASPAIVPAPAGSAYRHLGVQMGKDGLLHLLNLDDMSGTGTPGMIGGDLQTLTIATTIPTNPIPQPATWIDAGDGSTWLYVPTVADGLAALEVEIGDGGLPSLAVRWTLHGTISTPVVANNIVFWSGHALDPRTGNAIADGMPNCCYWGGPIVVDGRVIVTGGYNQVWIYGIDAVFANGFD